MIGIGVFQFSAISKYTYVNVCRSIIYVLCTIYQQRFQMLSIEIRFDDFEGLIPKGLNDFEALFPRGFSDVEGLSQ